MSPENDLFVMLTYPNDIPKGFRVRIGEREHEGFDSEVAFVAIKNAHHHNVGYFLDTGEHASERPASFPLAELKDRMMAACGVESASSAVRDAG